ncbi:MAG: hypothetical protein NWQ19_07605 [Nonlabens sp.]|nr:hypothetical protein [Nonlabens sp.]
MNFNWSKVLVYAIGIAAALIIYFLILNALGLGGEIYMSFLNAVITTGGVYLLIRNTFRKEGKSFEYMNGFITAAAAGFISTIIFTVFMAIYLTEINTELAATMASKISTIKGSGEFEILLFIALSGFATSLVAALVIMPVFKQSWNTKQVRESQKPMNQK